MTKTYLLLSLAILILLVGCTQKQGETVEIQPFVGGTTGLDTEFVELRKEVFDGGRDPFDVIVKLENRGESFIPKEKITVSLSGINPSEFSKLEEQLVKQPEDDLVETVKDATGQVIPGPPIFVEFTELNHFSPIAASAFDFPLRASVCYLYSTKAVSKLCVKSDILNSKPGGICEINEDKPTFSSGAPIQIINFKESARAREKLGFGFEIINSGSGVIFQSNTNCDKGKRGNQNKVFVKVDTNTKGVSCTGLESKDRTAEGYVTLFGNSKLVTCSQPISTKTDYEQLVKIEVFYDYEEFKETAITVKNSGG